jgi:lysophospholipase
VSARSFNRREIPTGARLSSWVGPDGWSHRRLEWRQPKRRDARGSLLFAGGRGDFIEKYLEPLGHWHAAGWNVTAFDWRGQGGSRGDIVGGNIESLDPLVGDLAALIDDWRARTPAPHVAVAHSMGGHVLLRVLAEQRPELDAVVLVAPMLAINSGVLPRVAASFLASSVSLMGWGRQPVWRPADPPPPSGSFRQGTLTGCPERYADELWWWEKEPGFNLGAPSWGWLRGAYASCGKLTPEALARVEVPVLLLATERDRLVSAAAIRRAAERLPNAELVMLNEAAHEILRERDAVRLRAMAAIDDFLHRRAPGR